LKAFAVEADTGVIGGKFSHEFMIPAETGENEVVFAKAAVTRQTSKRRRAEFPKLPHAKSARRLKNLPRPAS